MLGVGVLSKPGDGAAHARGSARSAECFRQVPVARSKVFPFQGVHQALSGLAVIECGPDRVSVGATRSRRRNDSPLGSSCASMVAGMTRDRGSREPHRTRGSVDRELSPTTASQRLEIQHFSASRGLDRPADTILTAKHEDRNATRRPTTSVVTSPLRAETRRRNSASSIHRATVRRPILAVMVAAAYVAPVARLSMTSRSRSARRR
jgi:hypothetical protein